jgi:hypothetical protein
LELRLPPEGRVAWEAVVCGPQRGGRSSLSSGDGRTRPAGRGPGAVSLGQTSEDHDYID